VCFWGFFNDDDQFASLAWDNILNWLESIVSSVHLLGIKLGWPIRFTLKTITANKSESAAARC